VRLLTPIGVGEFEEACVVANAQVARSPVDGLRARLDDPQVAAALDDLLRHADLLAPLVDGLDGGIRRGDVIHPSTPASVEVLVVDLGGRLTAYRNECAHEALPLDSAPPDVAAGTLLWDRGRTTGGAADHVLAQAGFAENGENRWSAVGDDTLGRPYGLSLRGDLLAVADSGNNRVVLRRRS
jgi:hypothetical protein